MQVRRIDDFYECTIPYSPASFLLRTRVLPWIENNGGLTAPEEDGAVYEQQH